MLTNAFTSPKYGAGQCCSPGSFSETHTSSPHRAHTTNPRRLANGEASVRLTLVLAVHSKPKLDPQPAMQAAQRPRMCGAWQALPHRWLLCILHAGHGDTCQSQNANQQVRPLSWWLRKSVLQISTTLSCSRPSYRN